MKAKLEKTGEIVEVNPILINKVLVFETPDMHIYGTEELEFDKNPFKDYIDWEQRRFELVKAAMQGLTTIDNERGSLTIDTIVKLSINIADSIIAKLKKE